MTAALFLKGCKSPLLSLTEPPQVEESERPDAPETTFFETGGELGFLLVGFLLEGNDEYIRNTALLFMVQKPGDHQLIW